MTQRLILRCGECPVFAAYKERSKGKRYADQAIIATLDALLREQANLARKLEVLDIELRRKNAEVVMLTEVGRALQSTMELDELLVVILTAVTAGEGFGFNRAFLLLLDEKTSRIRGRMAVGPGRPDEAEMIWKAMESEGKSLGQILAELPKEARRRLNGIIDIARRIELAVDPTDNVVAQALEDGASVIVDDTKRDPKAHTIAEIIQSDAFIVVPLLAKGRRLGAIVADNFVTRRPFRREDVTLLETFASQAALAILNASLLSDLQSRLEELRKAHSELTENQLQLLRAERAVAAGGLASTFVHEVRTPLVSIGLTAKAALDEIEEGHPVRARLERIAAEVTHIESLLSSLVESAELQEATGLVKMEGILREALDVVRGAAESHNVKQILELKHTSSTVRGSPIQLRQVLVNLLSNAVEAMPDGGELRIRTSNRESMLSISIEDTGCGIREDLKQKIFSPFFSTKPEGSGLGLAIVRQIIRAHGGRISFESKEGVGTCFTLLLPLSSESAEAGCEQT